MHRIGNKPRQLLRSLTPGHGEMVRVFNHRDPTNVLLPNEVIPLIRSQISPVIQQPTHLSRIRRPILGRRRTRAIGLGADAILRPDEERLGYLLSETRVVEGEGDGPVRV